MSIVINFVGYRSLTTILQYKTTVFMKKNIKTPYVPPLVDSIMCDLAHTVLVGSVVVNAAVIIDAEEEEWVVS